MITIEGGTYGSKLDQKKETAYLMEHLLDAGVHTGTQQSHVPTYEREAFCYGRDDIGDTYIEVDMTQQKMYYYEKGELRLETDDCDRQYAADVWERRKASISSIISRRISVLAGTGVCLSCEILDACEGRYRYSRRRLAQRIRRGHLPDCRFPRLYQYTKGQNGRIV